MPEIALVLGIVAILVSSVLVLAWAPAGALLTWGVLLTIGGMGLGVPTGFWYHVKLRRALARVGVLPPGWWLRPVALHDRMRPEDRAGVLSWFFLGGLGFLVTLIGCALAAAGALKQ